MIVDRLSTVSPDILNLSSSLDKIYDYLNNTMNIRSQY